MARAAAEMAAAAGVSMSAVFAGLPFDAAGLRRLDRVTWDEYCVLLERIEEQVGGPAAMDELVERSYLGSFHELRQVLSTIVSPRHLMWFLNDVVAAFMFPAVATHYEDRGENRARLSVHLHPGARPCATFFRGNAAGLRGVPRHLGLPPARVRARTSPTHGIYDIGLPASRTLTARLGRATRAAFARVTGQLLFGFGDGVATDLDPADPETSERLEQARAAWGLSARQTVVLSHVVAGRPNKEIAAVLSCSEATVEFHVRMLLHKLGVASRAQIIVKFWRALP
jgi:DNA-binding CsgD family transcriptional regulator